MPAKVTKTSIITGVTRTLQLPYYDQVEFEKRYVAYKNGAVMLEDAFPEASASAREFIKTGITDEEWQRYMELGDKTYVMPG